MKRTMIALLLVGALAGAAAAHCDTLNGPVVNAAREALAKGDPKGVLVWVQSKDEAQIREAFARALDVHKFGGKAAELADTWFFETLVRVHRAGEGAAYTGLKPAGSADEIVKKLDASLEKGDISELAGTIASHAEHSIHAKFEHVMALKRTAGQSVEEGRAFVAAYVEFMHYVENVKNAVHGGGHHGAAEEKPAEHKD